MEVTRIKALKELLTQMKLDAYIVPSSNEFQLQFTDEDSNRLQYLTGFTGSAGVAIITKSQNYFFTDSRYTEQARGELPSTFKIINTGKQTPSAWLASFMKQKKVVGFDSKLHSYAQINTLKGKANSGQLVAVKENLVDKIWKGKAYHPQLISPHSMQYAGQSTDAKYKLIAKHLSTNKLHATIINDPNSISWFLNIRAHAVQFAPCVTGFLIISLDETIFFTDDTISPDAAAHLRKARVEVRSLSKLGNQLRKFSKMQIEISTQASHWLWKQIKNPVISSTDPCILPKSCKNNTELQGAERACTRDSRAIMKCLQWLKANRNNTLTELDVSDKLLALRKAEAKFVSPSFPSIVGFQENAAIMHYRPTAKTNKSIQGNGILLIDSGGQYLDGTTDITRTISIGKPTPQQIQDFTLVLKGHIALITAVFPEGTTGSQLDILARMYLWREGKDYEHSTGHGVGSFLSVHEGPQNISKHAPTIALRTGMIVSIEPGFYKIGAYGIRIENLVYVARHKISGYLLFKILTYIPMDEHLIDNRMLTEEEKQWLKKYNRKCHEVFDSN